ncbi:MAG TPA: N-acetyl-gamma-glutamyl-phosphate reductase [Acidimicrobiales bacterium]|jgi:N-acetyl-gamma-glutamyl-phosphate reductase|nr:N-acetyl-gamma-glutamyl-phosphate reductase [Acidimicrobiales bacterium]
MPKRVGIFGASGYTGVELLRLAAGHPDLEVVLATADSQAGARAADLYPSLAAAYPNLVFTDPDPALADGLDLAFLALPHGASQHLVPDLRKRVGKIVDLAADFRLKDPALYPIWYGEEHHQPALLDQFAFGIPELFRADVAGADLIAAAGCYVTAAALALAPLVRQGVIDPTGVIVDAASGVSGAGRKPNHTTHFGTVNEDFTAYGLLNHRHTPEIEQATGAQVLFTPHLAPMTRGILATCYARPAAASTDPLATLDPLAALADFYAEEPFVVVAEAPPSTKATLGSNCAHLTARYDERTGYVVVLAALDNLVKGASGQAVQCANLALGLPEAAGLPLVAVYP